MISPDLKAPGADELLDEWPVPAPPDWLERVNAADTAGELAALLFSGPFSGPASDRADGEQHATGNRHRDNRQPVHVNANKVHRARFRSTLIRRVQYSRRGSEKSHWNTQQLPQGVSFTVGVLPALRWVLT